MKPQTAKPDTESRGADGTLMLQRQYRTFALNRADIDEEARTVPLSFSSEEPYQRWWGIEILGHKKDEVNMDWIAGGTAPLLKDHDRYNQIGVIETATLGSDRKGRAVVRFGKSARAEEEFQEVLNGVRSNISVGYEIDELTLMKETNDNSEYRVTKWTPLEVSTVSIPADRTVGVGKDDADRPAKAVRVCRSDAAPATIPVPIETSAKKEIQMTTAVDTQELDKIRTQARQEEADRTKGILALATRHNMREFAEEHIAKGTSLELFRGLALDELHKRGSDKPLNQPIAEIGLSKKEAQQFSVRKFMLSIANRNTADAPFEHECAKAVRAAMEKEGYRGQGPGNFLPYEIMSQPLPGVRVHEGRLMIGDQVISQRDLATTPLASGGAMVATDLLAADFITLLRNASLVRQMGARVLSGLVGNVAIPRQIGSVTPGWVAQSGAATESDASFAQVTMSMKTCHGIQDVTRDLLMQSTPAAEGLVRADLIETMATQLDFIALHGTGASNQPTGLANTAGIGSEAGGANGAAPTWDNVVNLESAVANNNAAQGATGYLTNTRVRGRLKRTQKFTGTNGQEIWQGPPAGADGGLYGTLNGYRAGVSNNVRSDLTKGTSTGVCSAIFFGNWADLLIGEWGTAEILPDEVTQASNRIIRMHIWQSLDIAVRRQQSFAAMLDALTV